MEEALTSIPGRNLPGGVCRRMIEAGFSCNVHQLVVCLGDPVVPAPGTGALGTEVGGGGGKRFQAPSFPLAGRPGERGGLGW